jgi:methyl-accepting chemotaxis protein
MKLTINQKLGSGFGIIILAVLISLYLNNRTGRKYQDLQNKIMTVLTPSRDNLSQLSDMIATSTILTKNWSFIVKTESDDKIALKKLHQTDFPDLRGNLNGLSQYWTDDEISVLQNVFVAIEDTLFAKQRYVMEQLYDMDAYNNALIKFEIDPMLEETGEIPLITQEINKRLGLLIHDFNQQAQVAQNQITSDFTGFQRLIIITNIILIIIVLISATYSQFSIVQPLKKIDLLIGRLATGNLSEKANIKQNDEIGMIATSVNTLIDGLRSTTNFANEIGKGHLDASFQTLSDDDILGNSLLNMRASLKRADTEEQKRKEEDDRRNWAAQGLAKFAEILRNNNTDMETMTHEVLYNLVRYIEANQGGIFVLNDSDRQHKYLEMRSCYAYDRKKFAEKQIEIGEGMVGTCFQEGETIYMTEVPHDYVEITSGLGGDTPTAILIVPLKVNEEIFGVLELAAFVEFQPYVKEFVEKVSESIASTISSLKVSERTSMLLDQAGIQAREMSEQEEELRQNMEELQATQEEWSRKEEEYESFSNAIEEAMLIIEMSTDFEVLRVNKNVVGKLGISENELLHRRYTDILGGARDMTGQDYKQVWQRLRQGEVQETTDQLTIRGKTYVCRQLFMPRKNNYREIYKYLCITAEIKQA